VVQRRSLPARTKNSVLCFTNNKEGEQFLNRGVIGSKVRLAVSINWIEDRNKLGGLGRR
jgi:hypothetical protein